MFQLLYFPLLHFPLPHFQRPRFNSGWTSNWQTAIGLHFPTDLLDARPLYEMGLYRSKRRYHCYETAKIEAVEDRLEYSVRPFVTTHLSSTKSVVMSVAMSKVGVVLCRAWSEKSMDSIDGISYCPTCTIIGRNVLPCCHMSTEPRPQMTCTVHCASKTSLIWLAITSTYIERFW